MVDPSKTTPKAENGGFSLKISQNDLENGKNPPFGPLGVVLEGWFIDQKCQATNFTLYKPLI